MNEEARNVYEEQLRLIEEEEVCAVEAAHLSAALKRNAACRRYIHAQEKNLLASSRKSSGTFSSERKPWCSVCINQRYIDMKMFLTTSIWTETITS